MTLTTFSNINQYRQEFLVQKLHNFDRPQTGLFPVQNWVDEKYIKILYEQFIEVKNSGVMAN